MGCQLLDGGKKAAKIPFQGVLKTGEIAGKTVYKTVRYQERQYIKPVR
jgi:hypothetical protein